jgi:hypothetical protein
LTEPSGWFITAAWQMANGKWQMANGKWQMANGKWHAYANVMALSHLRCILYNLYNL